MSIILISYRSAYWFYKFHIYIDLIAQSVNFLMQLFLCLFISITTAYLVNKKASQIQELEIKLIIIIILNGKVLTYKLPLEADIFEFVSFIDFFEI